jgi:hypothetical protein
MAFFASDEDADENAPIGRHDLHRVARPESSETHALHATSDAGQHERERCDDEREQDAEGERDPQFFHVTAPECDAFVPADLIQIADLVLAF